MKLGLSSSTYFWAVGIPGYPKIESPMTALQILDKAVRLGVQVVQIGDNVPLDELSNDQL